VSRLVGEVVSPEVRAAGDEVRRLMAAYRDKEDLIAIGAYQSGTDALTDAAIAARTPTDEFLRQRVDDPSTSEDADRGLLELAAYGELVHVPDPGPVAAPVEEPPAQQPGTPLAAAIPPLSLRT
jgi:flagellum-specific ATP synthase